VTDRRPASIAVQRRIEWFDTDASGHYHHAAALRLVEVAETALLGRLELRDRIGCLPRVHLNVDFHRPLLFGEMVTIEIKVAKLGRTSITYQFRIIKEEQICASGDVTAVLLNRPLGRPRPWPAGERALLAGAGELAAEQLTVAP
jgi:YbgC/YbaW family acyl-CoA thioester hydrolase